MSWSLTFVMLSPLLDIRQNWSKLVKFRPRFWTETAKTRHGHSPLPQIGQNDLQLSASHLHIATPTPAITVLLSLSTMGLTFTVVTGDKCLLRLDQGPTKSG